MEAYLDGNVRPRRVGTRAMQLLLAWLEPDHGGGTNLVEWAALALHQANSERDDQGPKSGTSPPVFTPQGLSLLSDFGC